MIENRGNKPADITVAGQDKDEVLEVRVEYGGFILPAGGREEVGIKVFSSDRGRAHHPFTVHVAEADGTAVELRGALDQRPVPKAVWRVPILLAALVLVLLLVSGPDVAKSIRLPSDESQSATASTAAVGPTDPSAATPTTGVAGGPPPSTPPEGGVAANPAVGAGEPGPAPSVGAPPPAGGPAAARIPRQPGRLCRLRLLESGVRPTSPSGPPLPGDRARLESSPKPARRILWRGASVVSC